jgi:hypothetical protein
MLGKSALLALLAVATVAGQVGPQMGPPAGDQGGFPQASAAPQGSDQPDPEDRNHGVARISLINGDVSVRRGDSGDIVAASINAPLMAGDSVQTGQASRAEIEFDTANRIRLNALSEVQMGDLRAGAIQVQMAKGTATFTVIGDSQAQVEVSTQIGALRPMQRGAYRVSVLDDGTTQFTVRAGEADVYTQRGTQHILAGQTMMLRGNPNDPEYQVVAAVARDEWDQFNEVRDRELARSTAYQHVSRDIPGAEDLDQYGRWSTDPTYGDVWAPNVAADWAPYQSGRWVWEDYYGWTWVSYDPWGWAPYHYGRWYRGPVGWVWVPGPVYARYAYRPALVGFFGFGAGVGYGLGFAFANLGWVALAPFELFHPWWGGGFGHGFTNVNVVDRVNIYNTYRNARVTNGVMSMSTQQFASGQFGHYTHPGALQLQSGGAVRGQLPIAPGNNSLRFNDRAAGASSRLASNTQQRFVSRGGFAPVQRQSFAQQRQSLQERFSGSRGVQEVGRGTPAASGGSSSWQRFGTPSSSASRTGGTGPAAASGWERFGTPSGSSSARSSAAPQYSSPARNYGGGGGGYGGASGGSSGRPVQIAPSIVQQRSYSAPSSGSRQSAPAPSNRSGGSAPSRASGHPTGGGGSHSAKSGGRR